MKDQLKQHNLHRFFQSEPKQLSIQPTVNTNCNNNNNNNHSATTNRNKNKNKNKNKSHAKSHAKSNTKIHNNTNKKDSNNSSSQKKKKRRRRKKKKKSSIDSVNILQCFDYNSDNSGINSISCGTVTPNDIIVVSPDSQAFDEYDLKDFTIDTIDQKNITIDEGDILEKIMNYGILEYEQTLHALHQAKLIYKNAFLNNQTFEEAKEKVETALKSFIE